MQQGVERLRHNRIRWGMHLDSCSIHCSCSGTPQGIPGRSWQHGGAVTDSCQPLEHINGIAQFAELPL